jgi:hypothetical protein
MASPFQRYQSGIEASTGNLVQAYGQMAGQTANAIAGFGQNLAEGIKQYNDNAQKSEMANAKIQSLGQAYADKIAMYSKDPEIAQSGILDGLMATAKTLSEAPTKGFAQRAQIAMDAEAKLAGFGGQLQEMMFLRGREMERVTQQGLDLAAGSKTVTDPRLTRELKLDPNKTFQQNKEDALAYLNKVRQLNPKLEGSDEDFLASVLSGYEQTVAKADPSVVPAAVTSSLLEQIAADKRLLKSKKESQQTGLVEDFLARGKKSSRADFEKTNTAAADVLIPKAEAPQGTIPAGIRKPVTTEEAKAAGEKAISLQKDINALFGTRKNLEPYEQKRKDEMLEKIKSLKETAASSGGTFNEASAAVQMSGINKVRTKIQSIADKSEIQYLTRLQDELQSGGYIGFLDRMAQYGLGDEKLLRETEAGIYSDPISRTVPQKAIVKELANIDKRRSELDTFVSELRRIQDLGLTESGADIMPDSKLAMQKRIKERIDALSKPRAEAEKVTPAKIREMAGNIVGAKPIAQQNPKVPVLEVGDVVLGSVTEEQKLSVRERQRQVADFVTSRMGAIDPTDPERKRRLPVAGFDKFYESLVPESEIREFTTDSGMRVVRMNGKWEQIKSEKPMTPAEMRKANVGVFGKQTADGRLVPTEFIPDSGVFVGGLFNGSDAAVDKYQEEMPKLIDAKRGIKELRRINDLVGESLMPAERGKALVEEMNLSAMLRTDIVGVGTVSNYEQKLIKDVTENSVNFFSLEAKDRAILIALAERVDRRIKNLSAAHGLTVMMKDDTGGNKYQALREQYLREKGIL